MNLGPDAMCWKWLIISLMFLLAVGGNASAANTFDPAITGLANGWATTTLYQGDLGIYPGKFTEDTNGNILLYDRGTNKVKAMSPTGVITTLVDLSALGSIQTIQTIAYQGVRNRLLIVTGSGGLYAYGTGGLLLLKPSGVSGNNIAVNPVDGSFYLGATTSIAHYGSDGDLLGSVGGFIFGVSQMALDAAAGVLYYSVPYLGGIYKVELSTNATQQLISGVGIPGTSEPISVAVDSQGVLYYFPSATGLYRYANGSSTKVLDSIGGAGDILWSARRNSFLQTQGAGANLLEYSPSAGASNLTSYLNAFAIAELADGTVIIPDFTSPNLLKVDSNGMSVFATRTGASCSAFTHNDAGAVYAACGNAVYRVGTDATLNLVTNFSSGNVANIAFDSLNNSLVIATNTNNGSQVGDATIWRLPLSGSASATAVASFQNITVNNVLPGVAADRSGNIFILERTANKIFKVANGSNLLTSFAVNVLNSAAITVPHILYLSSEDGLLVSTIQTYDLWPLANPSKQTFATNAGAVDNFATFETVSRDIVAVHSGQFFRMTRRGSNSLPASTITSDCLFNWAERTYPQLFAPAGVVSGSYAQYYYRYYPGTANYLATSSADNHIWMLGSSTGNALLDVGPISNFLNNASCL